MAVFILGFADCRLAGHLYAAVLLFISAAEPWWPLPFLSSGGLFSGYLYFYLNMTGVLFIPDTLACLVLGIYWKKSNKAGAYTAITLGLIPPFLYLILPEPYKTSHASTLGWGGFLLAFAGMIIGSWIKNKLNPQPVNIEK